MIYHMNINFLINGFRYFVTNIEIITLSKVLILFWKSCGVKMGKNIKFVGRCSLYRFNGSTVEIGDNVVFVSSSTINHIGLNRNCSISTETKDAKILIKDNCGFSSTNIIAFRSITIGNNVRVGANTVIMDGDFHFDDYRTKPSLPIVIDDNVWVGANVVIMKGVHIGKNSVVGMNSVVTKSIPANCIAAGNPCKIIRAL